MREVKAAQSAILLALVGISVAPGAASEPVRRGETAGFRVLARIVVGKNPHQITFTPDGATAYVAAAGSDRITQVDARSRRVVSALAVPGTPLGVVVAPSGKELFVSRFAADQILRFRIGEKEPIGHVVTGGAPSLLVGPYPGGKYLVSAEKANRLWVLDSERFVLERDCPTGSRPFPPSATSDGRLAFVPNYNDGTVTVIGLEGHRVLGTVRVGGKPSGGSVLPGDREYAVAVRGKNRIAFVSAAARKVAGTLTEGIGRSPSPSSFPPKDAWRLSTTLQATMSWFSNFRSGESSPAFPSARFRS